MRRIHATSERNSSKIKSGILREYQARDGSRKASEASRSDSIQRSETLKKKEGPKKVGRIFGPLWQTNRPFAYSMIEQGPDGWIDADKYLPLDYDLVIIKTDGRPLTGWHGGNIWDGIKVPEGLNVKYWRRKHEEEE